MEQQKSNEAPQEGQEPPVLQEATDLCQQEVAKEGESPSSEPKDETTKEPDLEQQKEWFSLDRAAFDRTYPDVDKEALFADDDFCDYAVGKVGVWPLADIYRGYKRMQSRFAREGQVMAARAANPGSLRQTTPEAEGEYYTLQQMQNMSPAYIEAHWDKVQQSIKHLAN